MRWFSIALEKVKNHLFVKFVHVTHVTKKYVLHMSMRKYAEDENVAS